MKFALMVSLILACCQSALASGIRTVRVNDTKMQPILLKMGKASVLRFSEKPKKVVIGNQNYYSIEFIENDLTIQPLGDVETNLFVYTPYHTYGFILRVCHSCGYDDLVYVKWKSKHTPAPKKKTQAKTTPGYKAIGLSFSIKDSLEFLIVKTSTDPTRNLRMVDMQVKNLEAQKVNLTTLRFVATRSGKPLGGQGYVIEKDSLKSEEASKARLFLPLSETRGFTLNGLLEKNKAKVIVGRKYLN